MPNLCIFPARALEEDGITDADLRVLATIGIFTDRDGSNCFANSRTLYKRAKVSRSTFFAGTKRLLAAGLIERESGQLAGRSSNYRVCLDARGGVRAAGLPVSSQPDSGVRPGLDSPTMTDPFTDSSSSAFSLTGAEERVQYRGKEIVVQPWVEDLKMLLERVRKAGGTETAWLSEIAAATDGMHGPKRSPAEIGQSIRDFNAAGGDISLRLFRGYLRGNGSNGSQNGPSAKPGGKNGQKPGWLVRKELDDDDAALNRDPETKRVVDEAIAKRGEQWWARMKREAKAADRFVYPYALKTLQSEAP